MAMFIGNGFLFVISGFLIFLLWNQIRVEMKAKDILLRGKGMLALLWNQIRAELKSKEIIRSPEEYMIRAEPNHVLRWGITTVIVLLYALRIFFFEEGYFVLTLIFGFYYFDHLKDHLFPQILCVRVASDWAYFVEYAPDGQVLQTTPRIIGLFSNQFSPDDFISFVNRILEFKFWVTTMIIFLFAFLLTWIPIFKCTSLGPDILLMWISSFGWGFVPAMMESIKRSEYGVPLGVLP